MAALNTWYFRREVLWVVFVAVKELGESQSAVASTVDGRGGEGGLCGTAVAAAGKDM